MHAEPFVDGVGQRIFPFFSPPCSRCPWRTQGRCSGPQTVESQIRNQGELLSCFEPEGTKALLENLDCHRPPSNPLCFDVLQSLPTTIPVLCGGLPSELRLDSHTLYGIALDDLIDERGRIQFASATALRKSFRLPPEGRLCLLASVQDVRLEEFWRRSVVDHVWKQLRALAFEFVTGMSFSVFEKQSRSGQLFNGERNLRSAEFLAEAGLPVVPLLCEVLQEDLEKAVDWLTGQPTLEVIAGLAQGWKTDGEFARFLWRMRFLKTHVPRPLHLLVIGCSSADRVYRLFQELGDVTIANTNMTLRGVNGEGWDPKSRRLVRMPREVPRGTVIQESFEKFDAFCKSCANEALRTRYKERLQ